MTDGYRDAFIKTNLEKLELFIKQRAEKNKLRAQAIAHIITSKLNKRLNNISILEYGCNTGCAIREFALMGNNCVGVDVFQEVIDIAIRDNKEISNLKFLRISDKLPFQNQSFDFVFCTEVLEHVPRDQRKLYLEEFRRVLKKDGVGYISYPNFWFPIEPHSFIPFHHWIQRTKPRKGLVYEDIPSINETRNELKKSFDILDVSKDFLRSNYVTNYYSKPKVFLTKLISLTPFAIQDYLLLIPKQTN